jgi:hypothetical protein
LGSVAGWFGELVIGAVESSGARLVLTTIVLGEPQVAGEVHVGELSARV